MSSAKASPMEGAGSPAAVWHSLLRPDVELTQKYCEEFKAQLRAARLTFGDRIHCPFLRPFFLTEEEEARVRIVAETIAVLGERVVAAALENPSLLAQLGLRPEEEALARIPVSSARASTASRLDAFLLPGSLQFAEYNAESPAGPGYSETLAELFSALPVMQRFRESFEVAAYPVTRQLLDALLESYLEWGGTASPPVIAIVDWREVPTWSEFEIIQSRFQKMGAPTVVCDPRDLVFDGRTLAALGRKVDLVYRRVLINDVLARPVECGALVRAYTVVAVCVANTFRCKLAHVKAFFAVLTDERNAALFSDGERAIIEKHIPWTRIVADVKTAHRGASVELLEFMRRQRANLVMKPNDEYGGTGVTLGWETGENHWDSAIQRALSGRSGIWVVQERINIRREIFPYIRDGAGIEMRDMLVDIAPYLFRGKLAGYLTRLSATSLANVTSGGGQVPAFRVRPRTHAAA